MKGRAFAAVVAAQILFLAGWAAKHERVLQSGPTILLETAPADPRDLLRGDYVTLRYKISSIPLARLHPAGMSLRHIEGRPVFVWLVPQGRFHEVREASLEGPRPEWRAGEGVLVRGTAAWSWNDTLQVRYGLEEFFVPEGRGILPPGTVTVRAAVGRDGHAQLKALYVNDHPYP